jgi:hypothetical protein
MSAIFKRIGSIFTAQRTKTVKPTKNPPLEGPMTDDIIKATSSAFVTHPSADIYTRVWGVVNFDDMDRYYKLYYNVPFIKSAIDVLADFVVRNGWEFVGGKDEIRQEIEKLSRDLNLQNFLKEYIRLGLVYGTAYAEIIYENPPEPLMLKELEMNNMFQYYVRPTADENTQWVSENEKIIQYIYQRYEDELKRRKSWGRPIRLKTLDSRTVRVLGDSKGVIWGFIQFVGFPYIFLRKSQILYWPHERRSELFEYFYGTSILRPLLRIQAIITQLEEDISLATHFQAYTPIKAKVGLPDQPLPESKFREIKQVLEARQAGSNIIVPAYVDVEWMPLQQTLAARIEWFFKHLLREREQAIGIPRLFFGEVGGVSRGAAELLLLEFEAKIGSIQNDLTEVLMNQLFIPHIITVFGQVSREDIPQMVWKPVMTGELRQKVISAIEILRNENISEEEKAKVLEYLKDVIGVE